MILLALLALAHQYSYEEAPRSAWREFARWTVFHRETTFSVGDGPVAYDERSVSRRGGIVEVRFGRYSPRSGLPDTLSVSRVQIDCARRALRVMASGPMNRPRLLRQPFAPIRWGSTEGALADALCGQPANASAVLAAARTAAGGDAWDQVEGWEETGQRDGRPYRLWVRPGRHGRRMETGEGADRVVTGFNGSTAWRQRGDGTATERRNPYLLDQIVSSSFAGAHGYFFPDRFRFTARYLRTAREEGRSYDVLMLDPENGFRFELWFDRGSRLPARIVGLHEGQLATIELGEYRSLGRWLIAHAWTARAPDGTVVAQGRIEDVRFSSVDARLFDPPLPAGAPLTDAGIAAYAAAPFDQIAMMNRYETLGTHNDVRVVVDFACSDVCPDYTTRVIHYDVAPGPACARIGGVERVATVPVAISANQRLYCVPRVLGTEPIPLGGG